VPAFGARWASWSTRSAAARLPAGRSRRCRSAGRWAPISTPTSSTFPFDYEAYAAADALIGHGGITVFDDTADMGAMARFAMEFCAAESCGKCTPCRIGSVRGVELIDRIRDGGRPRARREANWLPQMHNAPKTVGRSRERKSRLLTDLCETMKFGSALRAGRLHAPIR
jgi:formate dehydrogenase iron-sulfur subunit